MGDIVTGRTRDVSYLLTADTMRHGSSIPAWANYSYLEFEAEITESGPHFPCFYARRALNSGGLRFVFAESPLDDVSRRFIANALAEYAATCRELGELTAFVVFFRPDPGASDYERSRAGFWAMLQWLHDNDPASWPIHVPKTPEHPLWEFCFNSVPLFILCSGPFHRRRRSRRTSSLALVFQPREQFARLMERPARLLTARSVIHRRVVAFDEIPMHPDILMHNEPENREWRQYIVPDENVSVPGPCPFAVRDDRASGGRPAAATLQ
ncbi:MAG: YqcI/YcgG family protein [Conexibacter sp.]